MQDLLHLRDEEQPHLLSLEQANLNNNNNNLLTNHKYSIDENKNNMFLEKTSNDFRVLS
jgi:hypothetical protein